MGGGTLKLKGETPWLVEKKRKMRKRPKEQPAAADGAEVGGEQPAEPEQEKQILGTDGKPIDPNSISVQSNKTYDEEFAHELAKLKKGGETKAVPWGSTVRAPPAILHGYSAPITGKTASERLDLRSASRSDKFCK